MPLQYGGSFQNNSQKEPKFQEWSQDFFKDFQLLVEKEIQSLKVASLNKGRLTHNISKERPEQIRNDVNNLFGDINCSPKVEETRLPPLKAQYETGKYRKYSLDSYPYPNTYNADPSISHLRGNMGATNSVLSGVGDGWMDNHSHFRTYTLPRTGSRSVSLGTNAHRIFNPTHPDDQEEVCQLLRVTPRFSRSHSLDEGKGLSPWALHHLSMIDQAHQHNRNFHSNSSVINRFHRISAPSPTPYNSSPMPSPNLSRSLHSVHSHSTQHQTAPVPIPQHKFSLPETKMPPFNPCEGVSGLNFKQNQITSSQEGIYGKIRKIGQTEKDNQSIQSTLIHNQRTSQKLSNGSLDTVIEKQNEYSQNDAENLLFKDDAVELLKTDNICKNSNSSLYQQSQFNSQSEGMINSKDNEILKKKSNAAPDIQITPAIMEEDNFTCEDTGSLYNSTKTSCAGISYKTGSSEFSKSSQTLPMLLQDNANREERRHTLPTTRDGLSLGLHNTSSQNLTLSFPPTFTTSSWETLPPAEETEVMEVKPIQIELPPKSPSIAESIPSSHSLNSSLSSLSQISGNEVSDFSSWSPCPVDNDQSSDSFKDRCPSQHLSPDVFLNPCKILNYYPKEENVRNPLDQSFNNSIEKDYNVSESSNDNINKSLQLSSNCSSPEPITGKLQLMPLNSKGGSEIIFSVCIPEDRKYEKQQSKHTQQNKSNSLDRRKSDHNEVRIIELIKKKHSFNEQDILSERLHSMNISNDVIDGEGKTRLGNVFTDSMENLRISQSTESEKLSSHESSKHLKCEKTKRNRNIQKSSNAETLSDKILPNELPEVDQDAFNKKQQIKKQELKSKRTSSKRIKSRLKGVIEVRS